MVNSSIAGGGGHCNCRGGNDMSGGSNGGGDNGGKITVEIPVYVVEDNHVIDQKYAEKLFNEILSVNTEKYIFYWCDVRSFITEYELTNISNGFCGYGYSEYTEEGIFKQNINIYLNDDIIIAIHKIDDIIDYEESNIYRYGIANNLSGTELIKGNIKFTIYYRER